ncbi:pleckstrin homology domain-containing family O member 2 [Echeneis naucrates]|uniref:PH domain-containing protein n=1 Tax=Echeneis naucrates TaxID=173247 RepID=A0A665U9K9_ECHNA|nr:pleckstrin homology domain-containing family O member 2 [Echeneis naucrates]
MEDGGKGNPAHSKELRFLTKAGWLKKAQGRLVASYKDRYIQVLKTEIVVYENEDLQNCLERLDLENYDHCHELKSPFKKKHRLILIRSPRSSNMVHDLKFQAPTAEEKEAWIKALTDCISRAKNKIFDEVKVDESSNLEHVTRTRPKGNRDRRPPTRIHMKEVAVVSSDGILRLDLDLENATMTNGMPLADVDGAEPPKQDVKVPMALSSACDAAEKESEVKPQKKVINPPMPPTKEMTPSSATENGPDQDGPNKKVLKPPMPPSKEAKPCSSPVEEVPDEARTGSPGATKKTAAPPAPPNKPSSSSSISNQAETLQGKPNSQAPTPPSKNKKPSHPGLDLDQDVQCIGGLEDGDEEKAEEDSSLTSQKRHDTLNVVDSPNVREPSESLLTASDSSDSSLQEEEDTPKSINLSPGLCSPAQKGKNTEEKSMDSGQHSDDDSDSSVSEGVLAFSTEALGESQAGLELLETSEGNIQITDAVKPQVSSEAAPSEHLKPKSSVKVAPKARSASIGDLLADSFVSAQARQHVKAEAGSVQSPADVIIKLEAEVFLEREKTGKLLNIVSQSQGRGDREDPQDLLAKALEKLESAELVLREVRKLKITKNSRERKSW